MAALLLVASLLSELLIKLLALLPVALQLAYVSASLYYANSSKCKLPTDECVLIFFSNDDENDEWSAYEKTVSPCGVFKSIT